MLRVEIRKLIRLQVMLCVVAVSLFAAADVFAQKASRIKFKRGAHSAYVSGTLSGYDSKRLYLLRVRSDQTLNTEAIGISQGNHYITIYITSPSGEPVGDSDASCNNRREIAPTEPGDYRIEVVECQKADPWRGSFRFRVTVK